MEGTQIGEETLDFRTLSSETANYVVHQAFSIWHYMQDPFVAYVPRRSEVKKGRKPWPQKGTGRARHGSFYSPLFGKSATNSKPHGLDNKRKKKFDRVTHCKCISTVLQSKWRGMKIVVGLEDWKEARQYKLMDHLKKWTGLEVGSRRTLIISRSGYGEMRKNMLKPTDLSFENPLYCSGRHIPKLEFRRPRDIDPESDGLFACLKARRIIISREAFFDLTAKYDKTTGWAFKSPSQIMLETCQKLMKEFPCDKRFEIMESRKLPPDQLGREEWAKEQRKMMLLREAE